MAGLMAGCKPTKTDQKPTKNRPILTSIFIKILTMHFLSDSCVCAFSPCPLEQSLKGVSGEVVILEEAAVSSSTACSQCSLAHESLTH